MTKSLRQHLCHPAFFAFYFFACSAPHADTPVIGASVLTGFAPESVSEMEVSMRPPSHAAWRVRLQRTSDSEWRLLNPQGTSDLADAPLIEHFLKVLATFTTEAKAGNGTDEIFGFTPYRVEIRIKSKTGVNGPEKETLLLLGDPTGSTEIFFRREAKAPPFIGRGALIVFLGHLQASSAFHLKSPFLGRYEDCTRIEFEKHERMGKGRWVFDREGGKWRQSSGKAILKPEQEALIERILRQRILHVENPVLPTLPTKPDWTLRIVSGNGNTPSQEVGIFFLLDQIFAVNPQRGKLPVELYPEFAGALRLFTQAEFTRVKSGIK